MTDPQSNQHSVYNLLILDESGSMQAIKQPTINGFNEVVQSIKYAQQKFREQKHFVSLVTFNGAGIKTLLSNQVAESLTELDDNLYAPNDGTPLYDAIGLGVNNLRKIVGEGTDHTVLVTILTDGEENASKEYRRQQIRVLIEELREKNWAFTYIGANHDVEKTAAAFSITASINFQADEADVKRVFNDEVNSRITFFEKRSRGVSAKEAETSYYIRSTEPEPDDKNTSKTFSTDDDF